MSAQRFSQAVLITCACGLPSLALASDFSVLMIILAGVALVFALVLGVIAYFATRRSQNIAYKSLVWGAFIAVSFTPLSTSGGNGTSSGPPILDGLISILGGDPVYAIGALKALVVSFPLCTGAVAAFLWARKIARDKEEAQG